MVKRASSTERSASKVASSKKSSTTKGGHVTTRSAVSGRFVSAAPLRTKAATGRLAATLTKLGADPEVVKAARRG